MVSATDADEEDTANSGKKILNDLIHHSFIHLLTDTDICARSLVRSSISLFVFPSVFVMVWSLVLNCLSCILVIYLLHSSFVLEKIRTFTSNPLGRYFTIVC